MSRKTIAIVDDHQIFLEGLSLLVESLGENFVVRGFSNPAEALSAINQDPNIDLVMCDLIMNSMNGLAFLSALRVHSPRLPVLILSGINTAPPIAEILQLGANGFVHKSSGNEVLYDAITSVFSGQPYFESVDGADFGGVVDDDIDPNWAVKPSLPKLAPRQIEVLQYMSQGATNREISNALNISENTVKTHLKNIFLELGVNKRTACVRKAQALGLI